ncbi:hypothetical protein ACLB2K_011144 [Fragaria x ananassa]
MGIAAFVWQSLSPTLPFLFLFNQDDYLPNSILGGRDFMEGGTWLACNKDGKVAFPKKHGSVNMPTIPASEAKAKRNHFGIVRNRDSTRFQKKEVWKRVGIV